jgi:20S proteasome alpha/beta subunit
VTVIVGILCTDGVVLGSDSSAQMGATLGQQPLQKVHKVNDNVLFAGTGAVGISQLIAEKLRSLWVKDLLHVKNPAQAMQSVGSQISQLVTPYLQSAVSLRQLGHSADASICKTLVALPVGNTPHLFIFEPNGAPEHVTIQLPFVACGSGQSIADPFLAFLKRLIWDKTSPTVAEGKLVAVWTIDHVRRTNTGGVGGGIQLGILEETKGKIPVVEMLSEIDILEHEQKVGSIEKAMVAEVKGTREDPTLFPVNITEPPSPPLEA